MTDDSRISSLARYSLLGRSGLRVSPLCLGTMTFGTEWGFGSPKETAHHLLDRYFAAGGNFLDTADYYTGGTSEAIIGEYFRERGGRDRAVIATKFTLNASAGDPNAGGNGRKNVYRALEGSLRRLKTDYVDLYWLHAWDGITPVEEVVRTIDDLVRAGKVRHFGLSDVPAWYLARAQTIAELGGYERVCALQLEYSLLERNIEREHIPAAIELGMGVCPWSPLASGLLSGKYRRDGKKPQGDGRLAVTAGKGNPMVEKFFTERSWGILDTLDAVSREVGRSHAQIALNWITRRPGVASTIIGATKPDQLEANLKSLEFELPPTLSAKLEAAGRPETVNPYLFFTPAMSGLTTGGAAVVREPDWYRSR
jgi:aryl-alcohol dehydrogenase-like predicted oxidoreductase